MTPHQAYRKSLEAGKRLPELEDIIMTNSYCSHYYALGIIDGKLPDKMHNMMIIHAIRDPNDFWVKSYFKIIEDTYSFPNQKIVKLVKSQLVKDAQDDFY